MGETVSPIFWLVLRVASQWCTRRTDGTSEIETTSPIASAYVTRRKVPEPYPSVKKRDLLDDYSVSLGFASSHYFFDLLLFPFFSKYPLRTKDGEPVNEQTYPPPD